MTSSIEFVEGDGGIVDWTLAEPSGGRASRPRTPNGVTEIDHVVMLAPNLEREDRRAGGTRASSCAGIREGETGMGTYRQAFFRLGRPILEVVEADDRRSVSGGSRSRPTTSTRRRELLGDKLGRVKDAVQPGRRIATMRKEAGLGLPVALISPKPKPRDP